MQQLGRGIAEFGGAFSEMDAQREQVEKFDAERRFQEFKWSETLSIDESMRNTEPGQADGFAKTWADGYTVRAKKFLQTVPDKFKTTYDARLFDTERDYYGNASVFERTEQKRSALADIDRITQTYQSRAANGEPLQSIRKDHQSLYETNPWLTPIEKEVEFRKSLSGLEEAHVKGRLARGEPLDDILNDLRGGALLDTDENPELRAKPFKTARKTYDPTTRFSKPVNAAINSAAEKNGVDPALLATFARIESSGNPNVRTGSYKGLFQLSDSEFKKYGGEGDIYDPVANADAAARKLTAEAALFEQKYGRPAQPIDLYMQHQQGIAGYEKHLANPDAPAWENMASTGEGKQKGDRWAKLAIWGNIPTDVRKQFPDGVESVTSADFVEIWRDKVSRFGGGSTSISGESAEPEYQFVGPYEALSAKDRTKLIGEVQIAARNVTLQAIEDGAEQIRRTGIAPVDGEGVTSLDKAHSILTRNQFEEARMKWQTASMEFEAMNGLPMLPEAEMEDRLAAFEPEVGDELYAERVKIYEKLTKEVNKLRDAREKDPASAVSQAPNVMIAEQGIKENPGDPQFVQELARARIDAQAEVGIPETLRSPITKQEARVLMAPVKGLQDKALKDALVGVREQIEQQYGPYARAAAVEAVSLIYGDKAIGEEIEGLLTSAMKGLPASAAQQRRVEFLTETNLATRAFGGDFVGEPNQQYFGRGAVPSNVMPGANAEAAFGEGPLREFRPAGQAETGMPVQVNPANAYRMRKPPKAAIDALQANPQLRDQFDEFYGSGSADRFLVQ